MALQALQLTGFMRDQRQHATPQRFNPTFAYFRAADDKYLALGILDPKWWKALCDALGRPELPNDERFADARRRQHNREALLAELDASFAARPRDEWLRLLREADVPAGPVHDYAAVVQDPQVLANEYITTLEHPALGSVGGVGTPIKMSGMPTGPRTTAPELGQHTEEVLLELGYSWPDIEELKKAEVV